MLSVKEAKLKVEKSTTDANQPIKDYLDNYSRFKLIMAETSDK